MTTLPAPRGIPPNVARSARRTVVYMLLGGASLIFLTPFLWLIITSLKPIDQAMSLPPTILPRAYYAELGGERVEVIRDYTVGQPGVVAEIIAGERQGQRVVLSDAQVAAQPGLALRVEHRVAAGWVRVIERIETGAARAARWDVVAPDAIEDTIQFRWANYPSALNRMGGENGRAGFGRFLTNTLVVCILGVFGTVFSNAIVAYGFARLEWKGRDALFAVTLATMMVPLYGVFKSLGLVGTLVPLWLPAFFGSAFNIFLMRQFFRSIPEELSEAARIDGCSEWRIFWWIVLPLSKPVLITAALFHFLFAWNDFMGPLLYSTRTEDYTLALALQSFQSQTGGVQWHYLMAASAVVIAPTVVLFFLAQKTFVQGIATTGSKS